MIERLLELDDLLLYPETLNAGNNTGKNFGVLDEIDRGTYLPIFTSDTDSIVNNSNWNVFSNVGIRPVLPQTEDLQIRLAGCQYIFASFTLEEIRTNFILRPQAVQNILRISIVNEGNGHDTAILNTAMELRNIYNDRVSIMAGNIANPKTYVEYCKAKIDYVRVGIGTSSLVDQEATGIYYPMASLLIDILGLQKTSCAGLKLTKIVADGGILEPVDILKALAIGADYVMIGRSFAKLVEAAGPIFHKERDENGVREEEVPRGSVIDVPESDLKSMELKRKYYGNSSKSPKSGWVKVDSKLDGWIKKAYNTFERGFTMANATGWKEFKEHIKVCRIH